MEDICKNLIFPPIFHKWHAPEKNQAISKKKCRLTTQSVEQFCAGKPRIQILRGDMKNPDKFLKQRQLYRKWNKIAYNFHKYMVYMMNIQL